jgi:hypothetical protein
MELRPTRRPPNRDGPFAHSLALPLLVRRRPKAAIMFPLASPTSTHVCVTEPAEIARGKGEAI